MSPKACYILTHDPNTTGGIETVVKNMSEGRDVRWLGCGGACSIIKGFITALKLRFSDYDIIHSHDNAGYWLTWLARNKKIIWTAQGLMKSYFEENPPKGWKKRLDAWVLLRMQSRIIKKSHAVVPINRSISARLRKEYKIEPLEVVHNGVDTDNFRPMKCQKRFDYIWVSTNPAKARLKECIEFTEGKSMLAVGIAGQDSKQVKYRRAARHEMPKLYNSARTLVYFSRQADYSLAILESMACGLNIVTNDYILNELTERSRPVGSVTLDGKEAAVVFLSGKDARRTALSMDWKNIRAKYKKIYENLYLEK